MKETRITVVFTGGTIGSAVKDGFLSPGGEEPRRLLIERFAKEKQSFYEERFRTRILFETACPYEILSENLNGGHLEALWRAVSRAIEGGCDGIIITTGTDSLAYSSAAMGYLFADIGIPIVMVSANAPLTDVHGNGFANFEGAMLLLLEKAHQGVFCSYQNRDGHYLHHATRLLAQSNYSDSVFSVADKYYAKIEDGRCKMRQETPAGGDADNGVKTAAGSNGNSREKIALGGGENNSIKWNLTCQNLEHFFCLLLQTLSGNAFSASE